MLPSSVIINSYPLPPVLTHQTSEVWLAIKDHLNFCKVFSLLSRLSCTHPLTARTLLLLWLAAGCWLLLCPALPCCCCCSFRALGKSGTIYMRFRPPGPNVQISLAPNVESIQLALLWRQNLAFEGWWVIGEGTNTQQEKTLKNTFDTYLTLIVVN